MARVLSGFGRTLLAVSLAACRESSTPGDSSKDAGPANTSPDSGAVVTANDDGGMLDAAEATADAGDGQTGDALGPSSPPDE